MEANFILNSFRTIVAVIDRAIYGLIGFLYEILQILASHQLFGEQEIDNFASRVYIFLGLIMVFKVTFSLINYLVNPDMINDKSQGATNIAKNIVITLILIIVVPYVFDFGYRLQDAILKDNIIPKIILGDVDTSTLTFNMDKNYCENINLGDSNSSREEIYGQYISLMAFRPFYRIDDSSEISYDASSIESYCKARSVKELLQPEIYKADEGLNDQNNIGKYIIDYSMILSTAAGVVVLLMMLTLCMDVAVRAIKLGFLEIIAPVPIISYVDPKSGKDGIFKKWTKEVINTWASLFIKLAAINFAIYIIDLVGKSNLGSEKHGIWIMLFLIIGALMFAKQFTKLIEDIFGIKLDGMSLHPIKKIQEQAVGGKAIAGAITGTGAALGVGAVSAVGAGAANVFNNRRHKMDGQFTLKNNIKSFGSGMLYGAYHGMKNGYSTGKDGKLKLGTNTINSIKSASSDRNLNEALVKQGASKAPFAKARFMYEDWKTDLMGYQGKGGSTDELKEELKRLERQKELSEVKYNNAIETSSRILATAPTQLRDALNKYNPLNIDYKTDGNGNIVLNSDGQVEWKLDKLVTYEDFMKSHGNEFKFENESQKEQFRVAYQSLYNASTDYRESYNSMVDADKKQTKLEKEKAKFEATKKTAK